MLNEIEELEQYIGDIEKCTRLSSRLFLNKNRGGIPRALTIIARHYLFDEYHYATLSDKSQRESARENTKRILAAWCGFDYEKNISDESVIKRDKIENWLPLYIKAKTSEKSLDETSVENQLASFKKEYEKKWYVKSQKDLYQLVNHTFNIDAINFYSIIADAIKAGPLVVRELLYNKEDFEKDFKLKEKSRNYIIKIIGAYLIALNGQAPNNQSIRLNNVDLSNWMGNPSLANSNHKESLFNENTAFITSYKNGIYTIDKDFLTKYDFKLK